MSYFTETSTGTIQCIGKLFESVGPPIPQIYPQACKIGNLALILRKPRHENRRFSESEGMG